MFRKSTLAICVCFLAYPVFGATIHVPEDAPTIGIAIAKAAPFDTIIVAPGTYFEAINFGGKVIVVQSSNPNDPDVVASTLINAGGLGDVVTFSGGEDQSNTILDGFTITGGTVGIRGNGSPAVVRRCIVRDNSSTGIDNANGVIEDCEIRNNQGSGMFNCDGTIRRSLIMNNRKGLENCDGLIVDSTIEQSFVTSSSEAAIQNGTVDILRCVIARNASHGVRNHNGRIEQSFIVGNRLAGIVGSDSGLVVNSVIAGNRQSGFLQSRKTVLSCTVTGNRRYGFEHHTGTISHTVIWDNQLGALISSTTPAFSGTANPFFFIPGFWDQVNDIWVDGDYHLTQNSPFIDAGDPNYPNDPNATAEDIGGNARIVGVRVDLGAYEFQADCDGPDFDGDETPDICDADIDDDGVPNVADQCDLTPEGTTVDADGRPQADMNHDCIVDLRDYAIFQRDFVAP